MLALGLLKDKEGFQSFELPEPKIQAPDDVLIEVNEVGLDRTDFNMVRLGLQDISKDRNSIVLGHEMMGTVRAVGSEVKSLAPEDIVTMTVRRGCGQCEPCARNQSDMCLTGLFTERGIHKNDGFLTEFIVDKEQYIVKVPRRLGRIAVLTEPLSIAEKAIQQIRIIQSRLPWGCPHPNHTFLSKEWGGCKSALVVGAGPLGLMLTALLRLASATTFTADVVDEDSLKAELVRSTGATYIDARQKAPQELAAMCCIAGKLDIIVEAAGAAAMAIALVPYMSRSSIYVLTGIPREETILKLDASRLIRQMVRQNQVIVGSVNSNRGHFEKALRDFPLLSSRFKGTLEKIITHRFRLVEFDKAFASSDADHIKTVIEVSPR